MHKNDDLQTKQGIQFDRGAGRGGTAGDGYRDHLRPGCQESFVAADYQEYEKAWDMLDRQMVLLDQIGIQSLISSPNLSGVINDQHTGMQWRWQAVLEPMNIEQLYGLTMTLEWVSENRVRRIQCDTRLRAVTETTSTTTSTTTGAGTGTGTSTGTGTTGATGTTGSTGTSTGGTRTTR